MPMVKMSVVVQWPIAWWVKEFEMAEGDYVVEHGLEAVFPVAGNPVTQTSFVHRRSREWY